MPPADHAWTRTRFAERDGVRIAFDRLRDNESGEPLLLVMGLGTSRHGWPTGLCRELAAHGFAVARYDQRDAGESTRLPRRGTGNPFAALFGRRGHAYTAEDMADDATAVLDALGWPSAHLFGHSLGGPIAQRVALRSPGRVRSLTSSAALPSDTGGPGTLRYLRPRTLWRFARLRYPDTPEGRADAGVEVARIVASPGYPFDEAAIRERLSFDVHSGMSETDAQSRQIGAQWHGPALRTLRVPTLVLHGERDPLVRVGAGRRVARSVPGARMVTLPGVGHDLPAGVWRRVAVEVAALAGIGPVRTDQE